MSATAAGVGRAQQEHRHSTAGSSALLYAATVLGAVLSLGSVLVTARHLGAEGRGEIAFLTTVGTIVSQLSVLGVQQAAANRAGRAPELTPSISGAVLMLSALLGLGGGLLLSALVLLQPAVGAGADRRLLALVVAGLPVLVLQACLLQLAGAHYLFRACAAAVVLPPSLNVGLNTALALTGHLGVGTAVGTWLLGQLLGTALLSTVLVRRTGGVARPQRALVLALLAFGLRAHLGRVMMLGNYRLDQWLLGAMAGPVQLGLYSVAVAWSEALFMLPTAVSNAVRPDLVRHDEAGARREAAQAFRLSVLASLPTAAVLLLGAPILCVALFGSQFDGAVTPLRILVLGTPGIVAMKLLGGALVAQGRPLRETSAAGAAFTAIIVLNVLLVPRWGGTGAAIASATAYSIGGLVAAVLFVRTLGGRGRDLIPCVEDVRAARRLALALRRHRA